MKIVCVKCQCELYPEKNGVHVLETFGENIPAPYKLWMADLWKCGKCGFEIISGFGSTNYAEHFEPDFQRKLEMATPLFWDFGRIRR